MLAAGAKLGPYEVVGAIGAGGMGEVYRARDTKLGREVALKVLPEGFAADAERMGRFEREAKVLASLNHPNIAAIYGFEDSGSVHALVMEMVEGQTLAERIGEPGTRGAGPRGAGLKAGATQAGAAGPMPVDEALPIAKQIAEGLEYAHERGIVHRDLKPANVKITPDGVVKILDFGLAKALSGETAAADPSTSPTLSHLATQAGVILGTAAYMAPEQAKGKPVDRRADIWAFGCVLFEMLTAKKPFDGETVTDILIAVVTKQPDWTLLPKSTPAHIRVLLQRCLQKDPKQRLRDIGEARITLEETPSGGASPEETPTGVRALRSRREIAAWSLVAVLALLAAGLGARMWLARSEPAAAAIVSQILSPPNERFAFLRGHAGPPAISPNGKWLAFVAVSSDGKQELWVRRLNAATAQPLAGTEGAGLPFWSPDSRSIGFFADGELRRIGVDGGPTLTLARARTGTGGTWNQDGTILFGPNPVSPLFRVSASGGARHQVTKLLSSSSQTGDLWPQFLPDGKHFLFLAVSTVKGQASTWIGSLDGGAPKLIERGDSDVLYASPGYLIFARHGTLMAQPFDAASLQLTGQATQLAENVAKSPIFGLGDFTVSQNGILVYRAGGILEDLSQILWFNRSGKKLGEVGAPGYFMSPSLSPDGRNLAVSVYSPEASTSSIWIYNLAQGTRTRLTFPSPPDSDAEPMWSPDGKTIAFRGTRGGHFHVYEKAADGAGSTSPLVVGDVDETLPSFSPDGRYLIYKRAESQPHHFQEEIWALPLFGSRIPFPVLQNPQFNVGTPALSPDGKWLAYFSHEPGQSGIYIVPFLHGSGKWEVSSGGGRWPRWQQDGRDLYYLSPDNKLMAAEISEQNGGLMVGKVSALFQTNASRPAMSWPYDVAADGKKFVVLSRVSAKTSEPLTLVVNWPALLKSKQ